MVLKKNNTRIYNTYKLSNKEIKDTVGLVLKERNTLKYPITRSKRSYIREIKAHKRLYKLHLFVDHTKDTDLEENIKWYVELIYMIIGI